MNTNRAFLRDSPDETQGKHQNVLSLPLRSPPTTSISLSAPCIMKHKRSPSSSIEEASKKSYIAQENPQNTKYSLNEPAQNSQAENSLRPRYNSSNPLNIRSMLNTDPIDQPRSVEYETPTLRPDFSPCNINFLLNPDPYDDSNELTIAATDSSVESDGEPPEKSHSEPPSGQHDRAELKDSKGARILGRKYECNVCQKCFNRPSTLKTHMYSHTGERPFVCHYEGCNKRFSVESNLRRHLRIHYPESRNLRTKWIHTFVKK